MEKTQTIEEKVKDMLKYNAYKFRSRRKSYLGIYQLGYEYKTVHAKDSLTAQIMVGMDWILESVTKP